MLRISKLTFLNAVAFPFALGLGACFFGGDDSLETGGATGGDQPCAVGAASCPCTGNGACDPGLECEPTLHYCVIPDQCQVGGAGCECTSGGACDEGLICMQDFCVNNMPCHAEDTGTEGCQCTTGGGCDPDLDCLSGVCVNVPDTTSTTATTTETTSSSGTATDTDADSSTTAAESSTTSVVDGSTGG